MFKLSILSISLFTLLLASCATPINLQPNIPKPLLTPYGTYHVNILNFTIDWTFINKDTVIIKDSGSLHGTTTYYYKIDNNIITLYDYKTNTLYKWIYKAEYIPTLDFIIVTPALFAPSPQRNSSGTYVPGVQYELHKK